MDDGFGKTLVVGLVVGIICVVVIGGLILWFALGWHRLIGVKPRDTSAEQWDVESASKAPLWRKSFSSRSSFFSSRTNTNSAPGGTAVNEKQHKWPSPTGSRTSSGDTVVAPSPTRPADSDPKMAKAVLR